MPIRKELGNRWKSASGRKPVGGHLSLTYLSRGAFKKIYVGPHPYSLVPGSDWDLRLLHEHREMLALDSGLPARLVFLLFINFQRARRLFLCLV